MNLQFALILLGLGALVLVLFFSYAQGRIRFEERFSKLLEQIQFTGPLKRWLFPETISKPVHREPSLVSASDFRFDPDPDDSEGVLPPEVEEKAEA